MFRARRIIAFILIVMVTITSVVHTDGKVAKAANVYNVRNVVREFDYESAVFGAVLNKQMNNFLNKKGKERAKVTNKKNGKLSKVKFPLEKYRFDYNPTKLNRWVKEAIGMYPNLATLYRKVRYRYNGTTSKLTYIEIECCVPKGKIRKKTKEYKKQLDNLIRLPKKSPGMSTAEKIMYVHDRLVNIGHYKKDKSKTQHTAIGILLESKGICASYAYIMNHALNKLGIDTILFESDNHIWNVSRIDNKWYYVDATAGDPTLSDYPGLRSYVSHKYFLKHASVYEKNYSYTYDCAMAYKKVFDSLGNDYANYLPSDKIVTAMCYKNGLWYFGSGDKLYCWNAVTREYSEAPGVISNGRVCVAQVGKNIYYSNGGGLYLYDNGVSTLLVATSVFDMYVNKDVIYFDTGNGVYYPYNV